MSKDRAQVSFNIHDVSFDIHDVSFDIHDRPGFALVYLVFAYLPLLFGWSDWRLGLPATLLATALFLPLHFGYYRLEAGRPVLPWLLAVAAIGYALIPFNGGGNTFLVYAMAMAAVGLPTKRAFALGLALLLAMVGELALLAPWQAVLGFSAVTGTIGAIVMTGIAYSRERTRQYAQLRLSQDEVRRLARMAERERIGRDLHDLLGHTLSVIALKSELAGKLFERDPDAARVQIAEVERVAREALAQVREAVAGIRATGLQAELASARLALLAADVRLDQRLAPVPISAEVEQTLALALREAVTNVIRHADARRVEVELGEDGGRLCLAVADDGRGGVEAHGNGLTGMSERLAAVGGWLEIESARGGGTRLLLRVPRGESEEAAG